MQIYASAIRLIGKVSVGDLPLPIHDIYQGLIENSLNYEIGYPIKTVWPFSGKFYQSMSGVEQFSLYFSEGFFMYGKTFLNNFKLHILYFTSNNAYFIIEHCIH